MRVQHRIETLSDPTIVGTDAGMIIVDDPDGVVVPSPGVKIMRRVIGLRPSQSMIAIAADMMSSGLKDMRENAERANAPKIKGRAQRKRMKGLRP